MDDAPDLEEVRRAFNQCRKDADGRVDKSELSRVIQRLTGDFDLAGDVSAFENAQLTWPQVMALVGPSGSVGGPTSSADLVRSGGDSAPAGAARNRNAAEQAERTQIRHFGDEDDEFEHASQAPANRAGGDSSKTGGRRPRALAKALGSNWDDIESDSDEDEAAVDSPQAGNTASASARSSGTRPSNAQPHQQALASPREKTLQDLRSGQSSAKAVTNIRGSRDWAARDNLAALGSQAAAVAAEQAERRASRESQDGEQSRQQRSFVAGDRVVVEMHRGGSQHGVILSANPDGSFRIELDSGMLRRFVEPHSMQLERPGSSRKGGVSEESGGKQGGPSGSHRKHGVSESDSSSDEEKSAEAPTGGHVAHPMSGSFGSEKGGSGSSQSAAAAAAAAAAAPAAAGASGRRGSSAATGTVGEAASLAQAEASTVPSAGSGGESEALDSNNEGGAGGGGERSGRAKKKQPAAVGLLKEMFHRRSASRDKNKQRSDSGDPAEEAESSPSSRDSSDKKRLGSGISKALSWRPRSRSRSRSGTRSGDASDLAGGLESPTSSAVASSPDASAPAAAASSAAEHSESSSESSDDDDDALVPPPPPVDAPSPTGTTSGEQAASKAAGARRSSATGAMQTTNGNSGGERGRNGERSGPDKTPTRQRSFEGGTASSGDASSPSNTPARRGSNAVSRFSFRSRKRSGSGGDATANTPTSASAYSANAGNHRAASASPRRMPWSGLSKMKSLGTSMSRSLGGRARSRSSDKRQPETPDAEAAALPSPASVGDASSPGAAGGPARRRRTSAHAAERSNPSAAAAAAAAAALPERKPPLSPQYGASKKDVRRGKPPASPLPDSPHSGLGSGNGDDESSWVGFEGEEIDDDADVASTSEFLDEDEEEPEENFSYDSVFGAVRPDSPPAGAAAAAAGSGGPGAASALPDAVARYIGARARLERRLSATGPARDPDEAVLAPKTDEGAVAAIMRGLGLVNNGAGVMVARGVASAAQRTEQALPFTEAMFKAGVSESASATKQGTLLEGHLYKYGPGGLKGVRWHRRYFVLYTGASANDDPASTELRYYSGRTVAAWGVIPLGERGAVPLRLVTKIEQPSHAKWKGRRFDLVVRYRGEGRYPGCHIRPGTEHEVLTTKTFKFRAEDAQQRLLWVTVIEALMRRHGWGAAPQLPAAAAAAAARRRTSAAAANAAAAALASSPASPNRRTLSWRDGGERAPGHGVGIGHFGDEEVAENGANYRDNATKRQKSLSPSSRALAPGNGRGRSARGLTIGSGVDLNSSRDRFGSATHDYKRSSRERAESSAVKGGGSLSSSQMTIPFSPAGRRGSLSTRALSPPVPDLFERTNRTAPAAVLHQSSLRADLSAA